MLKDDEIEQVHNTKGLSRLLNHIYATDIREIQCDQARIQMVRRVYASLSEEQSRLQYPYLWLHFRFCPDCWQEYQMLRDLVKMEKSGQLQQPTYIPPPPDQTPAWWREVKKLIEVTCPGFSLALNKPAAASRVRGHKEFELVLVSLVQENSSRASPVVQIQFELVAKAYNRALYDLYCTISTDDASKDKLNGALAWLQLGDEGPAIQEKSLNNLNYVTFTNLQAGQYTLRLQLAGQTYAVTGIVLPQ